MITDMTEAPLTLGGVRLRTRKIADLEYINASQFRDELQVLEGMGFNGARNEAKYLLEYPEDVETVAKETGCDKSDLYIYDGEEVWMLPMLFVAYATYQSARILLDCYKAYYDAGGMFGDDDE